MARLWTKTAIGAMCTAGLLKACPPTPRAQALQDRVSSDDTSGDQGGQSSRFGRMFHLPPFAEPAPAITAALIRLGRRGGLLDANDNLAAGPINLIVDPLLSVDNPNNNTHTAGVTFVGPFLEHDMTFDTSSRLGRPPVHGDRPTRGVRSSI